jgi:hypothetical protein
MTKEQESKMNDYYLELREKGLLTTLSEANIFKLSYMQAFSLQGVSQQRELLIDGFNWYRQTSLNVDGYPSEDLADECIKGNL